ncbi:MAG: hypothetical protein WBM90_07125 [Acidimicrobiia bacterium]
MRKGWLVVFVAFGLLVAACSGDATEDTTTTIEVSAVTTPPAPSTTAAPSTTQPAVATTTPAATSAGVIPDPSTGVTVVPYADENITAGDVFLYWYREPGTGNYVVLYTGPGVAGSDGQMLCPGNSISTAAGFEYISNTAVEEGSCEGFPTDTSSVMVCSGGVWIYKTAIPNDVEGILFGSLEWNSADGSVKGLTSQFPTSPDMPELEFGLESYSLWEGFTSDGSTSVDCVLMS